MGSLFSSHQSSHQNKSAAPPKEAPAVRPNQDAVISQKDQACLQLKNARDKLKKYKKRVS